MKISHYDMNNYKLHIIKTNNTKKINVKIVFLNRLKRSTVTSRNLLRLILIQGNLKYPNERLLNIASEDLYDLSYGSSGVISGDASILSFSSSFVDSKFLKEDILESSLNFLFDIILKPNVKDGCFDEENFKLAYDKLKLNIEMEEENPDAYASRRFSEFMCKGENFSINPNGYIEDLVKIDSASLYQEYLDMINNDTVNIFVIGNVDEEKVKNICENDFLLKDKREKINISFNKYNEFRKKVNIISEYKDINQSKLFMGFKIEPLTLFEKQYVSYIYSNILGGSSDSKLFTNVREKNSLCYYVYSSVKSISDIMIIASGIDEKNFDKTVNLIKKELESMEKGAFSSDDVEKAITIYLNSYEAILDSQTQILSNLALNEYLNFDLIEDRIKNIKKVSKEDIINFASKIHLDTIYLLHGGDKLDTDI